MSLQYYDINLAVNGSKEFAAQGRYVYYLSGTTPLIAGGVTPSAAGNQAIRIKPAQGGGGEIILMPGQSMRLPDDEKAPSAWRISNYVNAETITGTVLIGEGEFVDNNTNNTIKLDATFANQVKVTNDTTARVPISFDPNQNINTSGSIMTYTNNAAIATGSTANVPTLVISAATNVNGIIIEQIINDCTVSNLFIAKATAPASKFDGDVVQALDGSKPNVPVVARQKIAAGKALYIWQTSVSAITGQVLFTVL